MSARIRAIDRLKRPEYTGENRCVPCTVANLVIAAALAVAVGLLLPSRFAPLLGALVLVASVSAVYLRGYLVPGTPWLTRTYFPDWLLRRFEKHPTSTRPTDGEEIDVEAVLVRAGALTECDHEDDLCLTPEFRDAWHERIAALREEDTSRDDLATILGVDAVRLSFDDHGSAFVARRHDTRVGQWESRAAFLADVAAGTVLAERAAGWEDLDVERRGRVLTGLRLFVEQCPTCGGRVSVEEDVVQSCCRSFDVVAATCAECDARLFEAELPEAA